MKTLFPGERDRTLSGRCWQKVGADGTAKPENNKGPTEANPLFCLVAGTGFESVTFGL